MLLSVPYTSEEDEIIDPSVNRQDIFLIPSVNNMSILKPYNLFILHTVTVDILIMDT